MNSFYDPTAGYVQTVGVIVLTSMENQFIVHFLIYRRILIRLIHVIQLLTTQGPTLIWSYSGMNAIATIYFLGQLVYALHYMIFCLLYIYIYI